MRAMLRGLWREGIGALLVLAVRLATLPRTFWEMDELLFASAVLKFDPWRSHPHPPGYPLHVGLGKLFNLFLHDPFASLIALNVICSVLAFVALSRAFRLYLEDDDLAVCGALLFSFSATMILHGPLAFADVPAILFVALTLWAAAAMRDDATLRSAIVLGLASSAAIGARPQLLVTLFPFVVFAVIVGRSGRKFLAALAAFTAMSLLWFVPLARAAGGLSRLIEWETQQAAYVAAHDAELSRGAHSLGMLVARFVAHPWGPKTIAIPVLAFATIGAVTLFRRRPRAFVPLALFGGVHLVFELTTMDPADAARYSIPLVAIIAAFAATGLGLLRTRVVAYVVTAIVGVASIVYVSPILIDRTKGPSPPAAAATFASQHFARDTVVLYDLALRPHADYLMPFRSLAIDDGLRLYYDRPEVPLVVFADGGSPSPHATAFAWRASDAYGKLTRNHYRRVALAPLPADERFLPLAGVHAPERTIEGANEWRWLAKDASLRLPSQHGAVATLEFRLSPDAPYDANPIALFVNGTAAASVVVTKEAKSVNVALPPGPCVIAIRAERSFHPAAILGNRDPRDVSVQLLRVQSGRRAV
jgi:hypothetical protein